MIARKIFNNNILLAEDKKQSEVILMGKGIGFALKPGDTVDASKIEKRFLIDSEEMTKKFISLMDDIPPRHLELTKMIVDSAEKELNTKFDDLIYVALADHINFAVKRARDNEFVQNALHWEIQRFYKKEFDAAKEAVSLIEYHEKIKLSEDEVSFIAMHFVNGQQSGQLMEKTVETTKIIHDILNIVKFHFKINLDEDSINYTRFVTHIRFFLQRRTDQIIDSDQFLFEQFQRKYTNTYSCCIKISNYLDTKINRGLNNEEMLYFMIHIIRLIEPKV